MSVRPIDDSLSIYERFVNTALNTSDDKGDNIRALAVDMHKDTQELQKILEIMNEVPTWQESWTNGVIESVLLNQASPAVAAQFADKAQFDYNGTYLITAWPPTQVDSLPAEDSSFQLYQNRSTKKLYLYTADSASPAWVEVSPRLYFITPQPTAETVNAMQKALQQAAEAKTQTAQAKQVYMQELIADQAKWNLAATNAQQRQENLLMQLISAW